MLFIFDTEADRASCNPSMPSELQPWDRAKGGLKFVRNKQKTEKDSTANKPTPPVTFLPGF